MKTTAMKTTPAKTARRGRPAGTKRWSKRVMETSDALDLEKGVFAKDDPRAGTRLKPRFNRLRSG